MPRASEFGLMGRLTIYWENDVRGSAGGSSKLLAVGGDFSQSPLFRPFRSTSPDIIEIKVIIRLSVNRQI